MSRRILATLQAWYIKTYNQLVANISTATATQDNTTETRGKIREIQNEYAPALSFKSLLVACGYVEDFLISVFSDNYDFVRNTAATRVNKDGLIESVAANIPRIDWINGVPEILIEEERTNVILDSQDPTTASWSTVDYATSTGDVLMGITSVRLTKNANNNGFWFATGSRNIQSFINAGSPASEKPATLLIKKGNTNRVGVFFLNFNSGTSNPYFVFQFSTKTFITVISGLTVSFKEVDTDVYLFYASMTDVSTSTIKRIWIAPINDSNATVDGGYIDFGFLQLENTGLNPSSYIPTTGSTVTRNADVATLDPPVGTTEIIQEIDGVDSTETTIPGTYQIPNGRIGKILMI